MPTRKKKRLSKDDKRRARVLAELKKRAELKTRLDLDKALFPSQLEFVTSKARRSAAVCSRRAGKSFGTAAKLLLSGFQTPNSYSVYVNKNQENARGILWPALRKLNDQFNLGLRFYGNRSEVLLPNNSRIINRGASNMADIDKLRGYAFVGVVIDEAQSFGKEELRYLIQEVLEPSMMDYGKAAWLSVTGTPNAACAGGFHDIAHNVGKEKGWEVYEWTMRDNPHIPNVALELKRIKSERGWTDNTPTFRREYNGEWIKDAEGLAIKYNEKKNLVHVWDPKPEEEWSYVLGIDIGTRDPTALVVVAYSQRQRRAVVVESYAESNIPPSTLAMRVQLMDQKYRFEKIVVDTQGQGAAHAEEMIQKHGIHAKAAQKTKKAVFIQYMNDDLQRGALQIHYNANRELIAEIEQLQWDQDKLAKDGKLVYDEKFPDHLTDALLYAHRECLHNWEVEEHHLPTPAFQPDMYWQNLEDKMFEENSPGESEPWWVEYCPVI